MSTIEDIISLLFLYTKAKELFWIMEFNQYAVGRAIRRIRKTSGLSQEVASGLAGLARSHLAMIENGGKKANFETIWRLANAFEMMPHELVREIEVETMQYE